MHCPAAWMHPCRPSLLHCRNKTPFQLFPIRPSRRKKLQSPNPANRTRNWRFPTKAYATISLGHTDVKLKYTLVKPMIQYGGKKQLLHMLHMGISATIVCCLHSFRYEADFCAEDIMLAFFELILLCFIKLLTHFLPGLLSLKGVLNLFDSTYSHTIPLILCNEGAETHITHSFNTIWLFFFLFYNRHFSSASHQCSPLFLHFNKPIWQCSLWDSRGFCTSTYWFSFPTHIKCTFYISLVPFFFALFCWFFAAWHTDSEEKNKEYWTCEVTISVSKSLFYLKSYKLFTLHFAQRKLFK